MRRLRRDDRGGQPIVVAEVRDHRGLAGAHDLDAALVDVILRELLEALVGAHDDRGGARRDDGAILHLRHRDRRHRRLGRDGGRALHPCLQLEHRQLLAVDREAEVARDGQLSRAFRQLDHQRVAVDGENLERLGLTRGRRGLRERRDGRQADGCRQGDADH